MKLLNEKQSPKKQIQNLDKRQDRIKALEILYSMEFQKLSDKSASNKNIQNLILGVQKNKEPIDHLIKKHSQNWKLDRIALLDLNILRIAIYEINFSTQKKSPKIFINEAIEIAKIYGSKDSFKFINGILDSIVKKGK